MKISKIFPTIILLLISLKSFSQDYEIPVLKDGIKDDILSLIYDSSNFVTEDDDHSSYNISYLKYSSSTAELFEKYDISTSRVEVTDQINDSPGISSTETLISVGNYAEYKNVIYYQCVQFAQAISNAGTATEQKKYNILGWKTDYKNLNEDSDISWKLIAKFKPDGFYDGSEGGHVALAIASNNKGIYVIDQNWEGTSYADYGKVGIHIIPWNIASQYTLVTKPSN